MATDYRKRKLTNTHRLTIFNLAGKTFTNPQLRSVETQAWNRFVEQIEADVAAIDPVELEICKKYRVTGTIKSISLPATLRLRESKTFERPDGEKVTRMADAEHVKIPASKTFIDPEKWGEVPRSGSKYDGVNETIFGYWHKRFVDLPRKLVVPLDRIPSQLLPITSKLDRGESVSEKSTERGGFMVDDWNVKNWISEKTLDRLKTWYIAASRRTAAEQQMLKGMHAFLCTAEQYGQVLTFWPEVEQIEDKLFGPRYAPTPNPLVRVEPEALNALCENMNRRGIKSSVCASKSAT